MPKKKLELKARSRSFSKSFGSWVLVSDLIQNVDHFLPDCLNSVTRSTSRVRILPYHADQPTCGVGPCDSMPNPEISLLPNINGCEDMEV